MKKTDVVLVTEDRYANPALITDYISNLLEDDRLLREALEKRGLSVERRSWSDPEFDWSTVKYAFLRTTWDYFRRFDEFLNWFNLTAEKTEFINSKEIIIWNLDKHYLADLKKKNVHVVETYFIEIGDTRSLSELCNLFPEKDLILKPAVSGAAYHTYRLNPENIPEYENIYRELIKTKSMLIQPFQKNIIERGEVAIMVMGGKFTHAVLKKAKPGDFRVQDDFGGSLHHYEPTSAEIQFAENAVMACSPVPLYGRADIVIDNHGEIAIMELELIEPELWFRRNPPAAEILADKIAGLF